MTTSSGLANDRHAAGHGGDNCPGRWFDLGGKSVGRAAAQRDRERRRAEIASDQARAAVDAPRSTRSLVDRLRRGEF